MKLTGRKAVVTGASAGIGLETLRLLLAEGCTVLAAVKPGEAIGLTHERLYVQPCDVSEPGDVDRLFARAVETLGEIDLFLANAGFAYYEKLGEADWRHISRIFNTNAVSVMYAAQKLKDLCGDRPFRFVTTASAMAILPLPGYALYSATKASVRAFAHAYRSELGTDQHFQVVYPIATRTAFFKEAGGSPVPWPSQRAETVAGAIVRGIKRGRKSIYPSRTFVWTMSADRILPFVFGLYGRMEDRRFQNWLKGKGRKTK